MDRIVIGARSKTPMNAKSLLRYITDEMRMSHIYQPVMIREILMAGGSASLETIAKALLSYDLSQVEYYQIRTKTMVGQVLTRNGFLKPVKELGKVVGYELDGVQDRTEQQIRELIDACDKKIEEYIGRRGARIWDHRTLADGYVPGSMRYEVLKRAKYRCELCGASAEEVSLHVDHIVPKSLGGRDQLSNFQALCVTCNSNKRNTDDVDFREIAARYSEREHGCPFCGIAADRIKAENELCYAIRDGFPVTKHHALVIPKRHVADYFDLFQPEMNAINQLLGEQRKAISDLDSSVVGFNVGVNSGEVAGQTIFHCHVHLIPRRRGDTPNPRGGVRGVIPERQSY